MVTYLRTELILSDTYWLKLEPKNRDISFRAESSRLKRWLTAALDIRFTNPEELIYCEILSIGGILLELYADEEDLP